MPHLAVDPIVAAAQLVVAAQTIASRGADPFAPFVLSIGQINGGTAPNVLAQDVVITGTVRSTREEERELAKRRLREICAGVGAASGAQCTLAYRDGYPATVSSEAEASIVADAARTVVGASGVVPPHKTLAGEDMAYYLNEIPGAFFFVGSSPNALEARSLQPGGALHGALRGVDCGIAAWSVESFAPAGSLTCTITHFARPLSLSASRL